MEKGVGQIIMEKTNDADTKTYIILTESKEFYCGKTKCYDKRMKEHLKEKYPYWFSLKQSRRNIKDSIIINGDFEKIIKRAGIKNVYNIIKKVSAS